MRGDFESAAIFLSPTCPVAKKGPEHKVGFNAAKILAVDAKTDIGKTGVELRYHTKREFWALPEDQRRKVSDHNATKEGGKFKGQGLNNFNRNKRRGTSGDSQITSEKKLKSWVSYSVAKSIKKHRKHQRLTQRKSSRRA